MEARRIQGFLGSIPKVDRALLPETAATTAENVRLTSGRLEALGAPKETQLLAQANPRTIYRMFNDAYSYWLSWQSQVDVAESPVYVENNFRIAFTSPDFEPRQTDFPTASLSGDLTALPSNWFVLGVTPPITAPTVTGVTGGSGTNVSRTYVYTFATAWGEESAPSPASTVFAGLPDGTWNLSIPDVAPPNTYTITNAVYSAGRLRLTVNSVFGLRAKERITLSGLLTAIDTSWRVDEVDTANLYVYITMDDPGTLSSTTGTATRDAPHNTVGMTKRVYRSITTAEGTGFFLVGADIPVATTTFADNITEIGEPLETLEWAMPPADMEGIVVHPSGSMVGFRGNEVYISEPYAPYAYKVSNVQVLDFPAVGLGVFGQSVVIGTTGKPYLLSFVTPETATPQKIDQQWPCLSKTGIVPFNGGVYYPTTVGLAFVGVDGAVLVTKDTFSQLGWLALNPSTMVGGFFDNKYYGMYTVDGASKILVVSDTELISTINVSATAIYSDRATGSIYVASENVISELNARISSVVPYSWTSKQFVVPNPINLGAAKIDFTSVTEVATIDDIEAQNTTIEVQNAPLLGNLTGLPGYSEVNAVEVNGSGLTDLIDVGTLGYVTFTLIVNGVPYFQRNVSDTKIFRLPAGLKYDRYSVQLSGTVPISSVVIAETPLALKAV